MDNCAPSCGVPVSSGVVVTSPKNKGAVLGWGAYIAITD